MFQISFTVEGDLDGFAADLMDRADEAVEKGAQLIVEYNQQLISNWQHGVPFDIRNENAPPATVGRMVACGDWIWQIVSNGADTGNFSTPGFMVFPRNYDPKISPDGGRGSGARTGEIVLARNIGARVIRPRNLPDKAIDGKVEYIWNVIQGVLNGSE